MISSSQTAMEPATESTPFHALRCLMQNAHVLAKSMEGAEYLLLLANSHTSHAPYLKVSDGLQNLLDNLLHVDTDALADTIAGWCRQEDCEEYVEHFDDARLAVERWGGVPDEQRPRVSETALDDFPPSQVAAAHEAPIEHVAGLLHAIGMSAWHTPEAVLVFFVSHRVPGAVQHQRFAFEVSEALMSMPDFCIDCSWRELFELLASALAVDISPLIGGVGAPPDPSQGSAPGLSQQSSVVAAARPKSKLQLDRAAISFAIQENLLDLFPGYRIKRYISLPKLPEMLTQFGLTFVNWPRGVPVPGLTTIVPEDGAPGRSKPVTLSALKKAQVDALLRGLTERNDARRTRLVAEEDLNDKDAEGRAPLFIEEEHRPRRWYANGVVDEGGPAHWR